LSQLAAIVLAAGKSTRMKSDLPKVLHEICGRPMLHYVLSACRVAGVDRLIVVAGHRKDDVLGAFEAERDIIWVEQAEQKGTGHAVLCCRSALADFEGSVLVIAGDMPLVRRSTLAGLNEAREQSGDAVTLATTVLDDPSGYGRIVRDSDGNLEAIVEDVDCSPEQRSIREVNPSYYCFDSSSLLDAVAKLEPAGPKGEYYITDAIRLFRQSGRVVSAPIQVPAEDAMGINSRVDLATVSRIMQDRLQRSLLDEGVTIVDPDNTWIEADVRVGRDTTIQPFTFIGAGARIGEGCRIGPFARVGAGERVGDGSVVGPDATVNARKAVP
jgi:bifunctional UDP-N-acetylglucosamine pyrophosphorylase / glucosamine-1-phosphate N-acetyltransferase